MAALQRPVLGVVLVLLHLGSAYQRFELCTAALVLLYAVYLPLKFNPSRMMSQADDHAQQSSVAAVCTLAGLAFEAEPQASNDTEHLADQKVSASEPDATGETAVVNQCLQLSQVKMQDLCVDSAPHCGAVSPAASPNSPTDPWGLPAISPQSSCELDQTSTNLWRQCSVTSDSETQNRTVSPKFLGTTSRHMLLLRSCSGRNDSGPAPLPSPLNSPLARRLTAERDEAAFSSRFNELVLQQCSPPVC